MSFDVDGVSQKLDWPKSSIEFCENFFYSNRPKYILGRNIYAESVAKLIEVNGFIDDFSSEQSFLKKPIVKSAQVPKNSLVLNVAGGRPLSAREKLNQLSLQNLDYFAFSKISKFPFLPLRFNEGFQDEFLSNKQKYNWIYQLLKDEESRWIFEKLVAFRYDHDISHLEGFTQREDVQYFEEFLLLNKENEVFIDVGGFNGYTTLEFIKRCPQYSAVYIFEPDKNNYQLCVSATSKLRDIYCYPLGLGNKKETLHFSTNGSSSTIADDGDAMIDVDQLDNLSHIAPSFIKIDIEGGEFSAIQGAKKIILRNHPRLAISVYHNSGDFWRIPELILGIRNDYEVLIRHYTESIYETVMFFLPRK
ncbi:FkbM family methyltransferase [Polynucleobacter sp. MWH-P3-07-1]|uniref:FkbM family methyltransferase n=1 Tax=Polynucleobacter sp. MWH-P3-07-1 TaxID=1743173 RepID=UPI001BFDF8D7|nr:FkbM family methyltransferase [Polynucleobacter sp. MWH-P3-07-1]QWD83806.1 FkbM family methyltransferase [Polynucleobacter sp. MWH-P3-07-1]